MGQSGQGPALHQDSCFRLLFCLAASWLKGRCFCSVRSLVKMWSEQGESDPATYPTSLAGIVGRCAADPQVTKRLLTSCVFASFLGLFDLRC